MEKISVIVPIYKVEKYLVTCVESIIKQDYSNLEIILVDDGSPDRCPQICDDFMKKDNRIKVIHKENGGLADARNVGIKYATGEYIAFVDSDDFVMENFISSMYENLKKYKVDIACCGFYKYYNELNIIDNNFVGIEQKYSCNEALKYLNIIGYFGYGSWNKLYKKQLFKDIEFPKNKKSEDVFVMHKIIFNAKNGIYYSSIPKYYYRQREGSITCSNDINMDVLDAIEENYRFYKENKIDMAIPYIVQYLAFVYIGVYNTIMCRKNDKNKMKELRDRVLLLKPNIIYDELSRSRKIQLYLFLHSKRLYNLIFKMFDRKRKQNYKKHTNNKFMLKDFVIKRIRYKIQHYNPDKYWKYRNRVINKEKNKLIRFYYLYKIKRMDAFNNSSLGTNFDKSATFSDIPCFPHGLNGIIISQFSQIGKDNIIYHQVTVGSKDDKTAPKIGDNVTIYPGAKIIGDIKIGNNCIIGAGAVVVSDIPDSCIVAGVPAKIIKKIEEV